MEKHLRTVYNAATMTMSILQQNLIAFLSACAGGLMAVTLGVSHRNLCALISFAAGTLLATTLMSIIPEASHTLSLLSILGALVSGYFLFFFISRYVFHVCPACAASHFDEQTASNFGKIAVLLGIALGIHSTLDGVALALGGEVEKKLGVSIFLTISIHKFPEGLALCALLLRAGFSRLKAFLVTFLFESTTWLGCLLGLVLWQGVTESRWFYLTLVHIGGGFLYLAQHAILNESEEHSPRFILSFFLIGMGTIILSQWIPVR